MKLNRDPNNRESEDNLNNEAVNDGLRILASMIVERIIEDRTRELQEEES